MISLKHFYMLIFSLQRKRPC